MKVDLSLQCILSMEEPYAGGVAIDVKKYVDNSDDSAEIWNMLEEAFEKAYQDIDVLSPLNAAEDWMEMHAEDLIKEAGYVFNEEDNCYEKIL